MPVDAAGAVADIIACPLSTVNRLNVGRSIEMYMGAAERAQRARVQAAVDANDWDGAWKLLTDFYQIISPWQYDAAMDKKVNRKQHIQHVLVNKIEIWSPTNNPKDPLDAVRELRSKYPAVNGPVTFRPPSGRRCTTKTDVQIGSAYYMLLEKTGNDWSGVSSAKLQVHGLPAKLTTMDRHASPGRQQPVRILGETETRLLSATCGSETTINILDQSNNPAVHRHIQQNILMADNPTHIDSVVDRKKHPVGGGRPQAYYQHMAASAGFRFTRGDD